ncbi:MAG TPA: glycoside hydrolase family 3 N-terminal domain-containing protein, partial [Ktedonobacterales bacterium]|nr:glycoside hydrolase family 3 N-terminal domain-containing protein [Ktedonobacterales bacterium]
MFRIFGSRMGHFPVFPSVRQLALGFGALCATLSILVLSACSGNPSVARMMTPTPTAPTMVPGAYPTATTQYPALIHWNRTQPLTAAQLADWYISQMSLDEEIGQLFIAEFTGPTFSADDYAMVRQEHVGGLILYNINLQTADQARQLLSTSQANAYLPLLMTIDQEGGYVNRLSNIYGPDPSETDIGATNDPNYAYQQGKTDAEHMKALGLNVNLAPDVDVQLVAGPDQVTRTFGSTPQQVIKMGGAFLDGMQDDGVIGTLKHFPGLGSATIDAHAGLPVIKSSRQQIEDIDLAPYRALIKAGKVHMIMTTDLLMPAIDPTYPAELSYATITGVLRNELGYDGVVITDALYMKGIFAKF